MEQMIRAGIATLLLAASGCAISPEGLDVYVEGAKGREKQRGARYDDTPPYRTSTAEVRAGVVLHFRIGPRPAEETP
jgi:hypothetical protein